MPFFTGRRLAVWWTTIVVLPAQALRADQTPVERINVTAVRPEPPVIDGRLIEQSWSRAEAASAFTQRDPDEGRPATERTEVKILCDNDALYIAARRDSQPELIGRRLSSRDGGKRRQQGRRPGRRSHHHLPRFDVRPADWRFVRRQRIQCPGRRNHLQ